MSVQSDYYSTGINLSGGQFGAPRDGGKRQHRGQDISHSSKPGTIGVPALHAGIVVSKTAPSSTHGFGYSIVIRSVLDGMEFDFRYAHGPWASQQVVGERIPQGKIILHEGNSGATVGSCVHIEQQRVGGGFLDPLPEIKRVAGGRLTEAAPAPAAPAPAPAPAAPAIDHDVVCSWNWGGIQKMLKHYDYGYEGGIDHVAGKGGPTLKAFQNFLNRKGYADRAGVGTLKLDGDPGDKTIRAMQQWLNESGRNAGKVDGVPGDQTKAAFHVAEAENYRAFPNVW